MRVAAEIKIPGKGTVTVRAFNHGSLPYEYFVVESTRPSFVDEANPRQEQQLEEAMRVAAKEAVHLSIYSGWKFPDGKYNLAA
jgi:hypothetical protein